jgi:hypothetical protein
MRAWERINLTRRIDKQMKIGKVSSIINSINQQTCKMKKGEISTYFLIITLNINSLNAPVKRQTTECIKKQDPTIFYL